MCVLSSVQLFETPWTSPPGSSVHEISQARILEWLPFPPPEDLPDPESSVFPTLAGGFFTTEPPGKLYYCDSFSNHLDVLYKYKFLRLQWVLDVVNQISGNKTWDSVLKNLCWGVSFYLLLFFFPSSLLPTHPSRLLFRDQE